MTRGERKVFTMARTSHRPPGRDRFHASSWHVEFRKAGAVAILAAAAMFAPGPVQAAGLGLGSAGGPTSQVGSGSTTGSPAVASAAPARHQLRTADGGAIGAAGPAEGGDGTMGGIAGPARGSGGTAGGASTDPASGTGTAAGPNGSSAHGQVNTPDDSPSITSDRLGTNSPPEGVAGNGNPARGGPAAGTTSGPAGNAGIDRGSL